MSTKGLVTCTLSSSNIDTRSLRLQTESAPDESRIEVREQNWTGFYHVHFEEPKGIIYEGLDRKDSQEVIRASEQGIRVFKGGKREEAGFFTKKPRQVSSGLLNRKRKEGAASSISTAAAGSQKRPVTSAVTTRTDNNPRPVALDECIEAVENAKMAASGDIRSRLSSSTGWLQLLPVLLSLDKTVNKDLNDYLNTLSHNLDDINTKVNFLIQQHRRHDSSSVKTNGLQEFQFDAKRNSLPETARRARPDVIQDADHKIFRTEKAKLSGTPPESLNRNISDEILNRVTAAGTLSPPSRVSRAVRRTEEESLEDALETSSQHFFKYQYPKKLKLKQHPAIKPNHSVNQEILSNKTQPKWSSPFSNNRYFMKRDESKKSKKRDPLKWESIEEEKSRLAKQDRLYKGKDLQNTSINSHTAIKNKPITSTKTILTVASGVNMPPYIEGFRPGKKPSINEFDRNMQLMKQTTALNRKREREAKEMTECTFKPAINNRRGSSSGAGRIDLQRQRSREITFRQENVGQR